MRKRASIGLIVILALGLLVVTAVRWRMSRVAEEGGDAELSPPALPGPHKTAPPEPAPEGPADLPAGETPDPVESGAIPERYSKASCTLKGRVFAADSGEALAGVRVEVWPDYPWLEEERKAAGEPPLHTETDGEGWFGIEGVGLGAEPVVLFLAKGRERYFDNLEADPCKAHRVDLEPDVTVFGRVLMADGTPVADAKVIALDQFCAFDWAEINLKSMPDALPRTVSRPDGRFELRGFSPGGEYELRAWDTQGNRGRSEMFDTPGPGQGRRKSCDVRIWGRGAVRIRVFAPSGEPVRGISYKDFQAWRKVPTEGGWIWDYAEEDVLEEEDFYALRGLKPGEYVVGIHVGSPGETQPQKKTVTVVPHQSAEIEFRLKAGLPLSGVVVAKDSGAPLRAELHMEPFVGDHPFQWRIQETTSRDGRFRFSCLPPGRVSLKVEPGQGGCFKTIFHLEAGAEDLRLALLPFPKLNGSVGVEEGEKRPGGVQFEFVSKRYRTEAFTLIDEHGRFSVTLPLTSDFQTAEALAAWEAKVTVFADVEGWPPFRAGEVLARPGETVHLGMLSRPAGRTLRGRVLGPGDKGVGELSIKLHLPNVRFARIATTKADGSFVFSDLPPWEGRLEIWSSRYPPVKMRIPPRERGPIVIRVSEGGFIRGRVTNADGTPAAETKVHLCPAGPDGSFDQCISQGWCPRTDAKGNFATRALNPGRYKLRVWVKGGETGPVAEVRDGETTEVEIRLPRDE
jgi:protocatechuate 3,4-dioxygenase beta subunit